jgi:hypothetical protein
MNAGSGTIDMNGIPPCFDALSRQFPFFCIGTRSPGERGLYRGTPYGGLIPRLHAITLQVEVRSGGVPSRYSVLDAQFGSLTNYSTVTEALFNDGTGTVHTVRLHTCCTCTYMLYVYVHVHAVRGVRAAHTVRYSTSVHTCTVRRLWELSTN